MRKASWLVTAILIASVFPMANAIAEPKIRFISPSAYAGATTQLVISDKEDRDTTFHLVAWVKDVPASPLVEFEIQPTAGNAVTLNATRVGTDTWEHAFDVPSTMPDGAYTLRAILYSGTNQVAINEQPVQINRDEVPPPPAAETVELAYPTNGGSAGFFNPRAGRPNVILETVTSDRTRQVRGFYTMSDPGDDPVWQFCGSARVSERFARVRCTLEEGHSALEVTALAAVANTTPPPAEPQAVGDNSGDAHRINPYIQVPTAVDVNPISRETAVGQCLMLEAQALDQQSRAIANVNVDVHATGPSDQLRFGTMFDQTGQLQQNSKFQPPDKGVHGTENAINCSNNETLNKQGDHNRPGANDDKHIESADNTNNAGLFSFALYSDVKGGTAVTVWADVDDDDSLGSTEATGGSTIGWGQPPPPPPNQLFIDPASAEAAVGSCQRVVLIARQGGSALAGVNVDLHALGPDQSITFCTAEGQSGSARPPDSGPHSAGVDPDGSIHIEGETDTTGRFVVGVTSGSQGAMQLTGWIDTTDDDVLGDEATARGEIGFGGREDRSISIEANRRRVEAGRKVRFTGKINNGTACTAQQLVKLKSRRPKSGRFRTIKTGATSDEGRYSITVKARRTMEYRAVAPPTEACGKAKSSTVRVRTT